MEALCVWWAVMIGSDPPLRTAQGWGNRKCKKAGSHRLLQWSGSFDWRAERSFGFLRWLQVKPAPVAQDDSVSAGENLRRGRFSGRRTVRDLVPEHRLVRTGKAPSTWRESTAPIRRLAFPGDLLRGYWFFFRMRLPMRYIRLRSGKGSRSSSSRSGSPLGTSWKLDLRYSLVQVQAWGK